MIQDVGSGQGNREEVAGSKKLFNQKSVLGLILLLEYLSEVGRRENAYLVTKLRSGHQEAGW